MKMLRKKTDGFLYNFTETLAKRADMELVEVDNGKVKQVISQDASKVQEFPKIQEKPTVEKKPSTIGEKQDIYPNRMNSKELKALLAKTQYKETMLDDMSRDALVELAQKALETPAQKLLKKVREA